ncbi:MAG TPA: tryptophan synthase subunit alpha [Acidimicrobiales bacterium]|nr:tryptophan synthase subunit alpha [Acidimicrobiales bacterium]
MSSGRLEAALRGARDGGRKLLVPYVTGGLRNDWADAVAAMAMAGADAIEIGIPFSDPVMDGPTIQEASARALERGATPTRVLEELVGMDAGVPLVAMTYYNLVFRAGHRRFASELARAGVCGAIVPDLPLEESGGWEADAARAGVETVLLAAPVTPDDRLVAIAARSRGFVYAVGLMGVTGERDAVAASAGVLATRIKGITDRPVLIGFGISTPTHAVTASRSADGVVVASALMRRYLDGASPEDLGAQVADMRAALDAMP